MLCQGLAGQGVGVGAVRLLRAAPAFTMRGGAVSDGPPGAMWQSWFVRCHQCNQVRDLGTRASVHEAVTAALENGWNTRSEEGWVCPEHFVYAGSGG